MHDRKSELIECLRACEWFVAILDAVEQSGLPDAWVGAGAIRDIVWDTKFGRGFNASQVKDVDVAYFDPSNLSRERDADATKALVALRPDIAWDAKNQAAVHTWYAKRFGVEVGPLVSIEDAVATWPETATAIAVRKRSERFEVIAPLGVDDLLDGVWRPNFSRLTVAESRRRLDAKESATRWRGLTVVGDDRH